MIKNLKLLQTGYTIARCAIAYGEAYFPYIDYKVSEATRRSLFALDLLYTAYVGSRVINKLSDQDKTGNNRYYIDIAVKCLALAGLTVLFVKGVNKISIPKLNPNDLLQQTTIPKETLQFVAEKSLDNFTAVWSKPLLENLVTGLFFTRTVLNLYLGYLTSERRWFFNAIVDAGTLFKSCQYRTLEIRHSFSYLFQFIDYSHNVDPIYTELSENFFAVPIKKVEAVFQLNVEGLSKQALTDKMQSIYDYSVNMFKNSFWNRYWLGGNQSKEYYENVITPMDQGFKAFSDFLTNYKLFYSVFVNQRPPAKVQVRLLHEHKIWQSFKGVAVLQWIPQFWIPAQKVPYSAWLDIKLDHPLTYADRFFALIKDVFLTLSKS